jgi:gliding motility-associated lipoprotein GldD
MKNMLFLLSFALLFSCNSEEEGLPKPRGYFRIDLPEHTYQKYAGECPISFEYSKSAKIEAASRAGAASSDCRFNIDYPKYKAKLHFSYHTVENQLPRLIDDSRKLVFKHVAKANAIEELDIIEKNKKVYGSIFEIGGNTASNIQFYATDSTNHFLRCSLYFWASPNADSLAPVLTFVRQDIKHLLSTFEWKPQQAN